MVQDLVGGEIVHADDERMTESALVRRVGRAECRVGGGVRPCRQRGQRLRGQCRREGLGRQVVRRLVRRRQQGGQVGVGAVGGEAVRPAAVAETGEEGADGVLGAGVVEVLQWGPCAACLLWYRYGDSAGEVGKTVRRQRGSLWTSRVCRQGVL